MNSSDSESHSSTFLTFLEQKYDVKDLDKFLMMKKSGDNGSNNNDKKTVNNKVRESMHENKTTKRENKSKGNSNESISG
jgi:hypothetical protein